MTGETPQTRQHAHGGCCAACSTDRQLLYMGTTRNDFEAYRADRGLPPFDDLTLPQQESTMQWLLRHLNRGGAV